MSSYYIFYIDYNYVTYQYFDIKEKAVKFYYTEINSPAKVFIKNSKLIMHEGENDDVAKCIGKAVAYGNLINF